MIENKIPIKDGSNSVERDLTKLEDEKRIKLVANSGSYFIDENKEDYKSQTTTEKKTVSYQT